MDIAIVTGASRGIGAAIAKKLASARIPVALFFKSNAEQANRVLEDIISANGRGIVVPCDVSVKADVERAILTVKQQLGSPSILVNNAGVGGPYHSVEQVSEAEWDWIMDTNLKGMFLLCRQLLPIMRQGGYGRIVNISSVLGLLGSAQSVVYSTSKHAIHGFTKSVAAEWGPYGITCNAICPGYVDEGMGIHEDQVKDHYQRVMRKSPIKRLAQANEIAELVHYLIGPSASYINGSALTIDGGLSSHIGL
jgi:3-oxoacyl-[acyl-carrier protein] reductase